MFDTDNHPAALGWLQRLSGVLNEFDDLPVDSYTDEQILALWRDAEIGRRMLAPIDHALLQEAAARHLAFTCGAKTITLLARDVLRISASEASARVKAAEALGRRRALTGELLAPIYGRVAAAQASGSVAEAAARVITGLIDTLPDQVRCEQDAWIEQFLVEQAQLLDVDALRRVARRVEATVDPDGLLKDVEYRRRRRDLRLTVRPWGSPRLRGRIQPRRVRRDRGVHRMAPHCPGRAGPTAS
jgi:hypothetical protein